MEHKLKFKVKYGIFDSHIQETREIEIDNQNSFAPSLMEALKLLEPCNYRITHEKLTYKHNLDKKIINLYQYDLLNTLTKDDDSIGEKINRFIKEYLPVNTNEIERDLYELANILIYFTNGGRYYLGCSLETTVE